MKNYIDTPREELIKELQELKLAYDALKLTARASHPESKLKEKAFLRSSEMLESIEKAAKIGGWEFDVETMAQTWTDEIFRILEMDLDKGTPKVPEGIDFIAPEFRSIATTAIQRAIEFGEPYDQEWQVITAKGNKRWVNAIATPQLENGKTRFVSGSFQDITERKQAEEALQKSEENLSITLHSIGDGVITTDKNGLVVGMNPVAEKLCGWQLAEAAGRKLSEVFNIINAETREAVADPVKKVLEKGEIVGLANHTVLFSRNGTEYQIADSTAPIKNKKDEITGVVLVFSDIAETYISQKQIVESEERFRGLLNNLEAGIVVHAPDTSIVMNNPRASVLLGLTDDQMKGKTAIDPAWKFVNEENTPLILDEYPVNRIVISKTPIKNQILGIRQPGRNDIVWVSVNGFPVLNNTGEITEIVISFIDITHLKESENLLKISEQIKSELSDKLNEAQKMAIIGSWEWNLKTNEVWWSDETYAIFGVSSHDFIPGFETNGKFIHPDDLDNYGKSFTHSLETGENLDKIFRINTPAGELKYISSKGKVIFDDSGLPARFIGTVMDITVHQKAELLLHEKTNEIEAQNEEYQQINEELNQTNQELAEAKEISEKNEARLKMALVVSKSGVWDWDILKNTFYWSDEFLQIFGLPENTIAGFEAWTKALHPDDIEKASVKIQEAIENHTELMSDYRIILPGNEIRWIRSTGHVSYANNKPVRMIGLCMDITSQKTAEQELLLSKVRAEESEKLLAKIADNFPNSFVSVIEKDLTVGFSGGQEFKRQNLNPNDFVGLTIEQVFGEFSTIVRENYLKTFDGIETTFELFINNQFQLYKTVPLFDEQKNITRILSVVENISERKLAENALKESEEKYRLAEIDLLEAQQLANIGSWHWDLKTGLVAWSKELYKINGHNPDIPVPVFADMASYYTPESWKILNEAVVRTFNTGKPYNLDFEMVKPDGTIIFTNTRGSANYNEAGELVSLHGTVQDITERKRLEDVHAFLSTSGYSGSDENFFESLAKYLATILDSEYVCIDKLEGDGLTAQTVAIYNEGKFDPNVSYTLRETPCGDVVGKTICCFPANVCQLFPHDQALQELKAHSYIGTTLWSYDGKPIGLIAIIGQKPLKNAGFAENVLKLVAIRAAGELERIQAEDGLKVAKLKAEEREAFFRSIFENSPVGKSITGIDGSLKTNKSFSDMLGYSLEEFQAKNLTDITHPDDIQKTKEVIEALLSGKGSVIRFEKKYLHKNGSVVYSEVVTTLQKNRDGKPLFFITSVQDITERKKAEEALLKSEENLSITLHSIGDGVISTDKNGLVVRMNPVAEKLCGWQLVEAAGKPLAEVFNIVNAENREAIVSPAVQVLETGQIVGLANHTILISKNRTEYFISDSAAPIIAKDGEISGVVMVFSDVTGKYLTEKALKQRESLYENLVEKMPDGVYKTTHQGRIIEVNSAILKILGYNSKEELLGVDIANELYFDPAEREQKTMEGLSNELITYRLRKKDGSEVWVEDNGWYTFNETGEILFHEGVLRDITDRRLAEKKLIESEERFNLAMKASNDGLFDWNLETNEIYYSPAWKKMLGYEDHELPNDFSVWENLTEKADVIKSWELQQKLISGQTDRFVLEFKMKHKDGHWVDILSKTEAIFNKRGKAVRMVGTHTNITERKQALQALLESEERFKALHNASFGGITIHDKGLILECNQGLSEMTGYSYDELIGMDGLLLIAPDWREFVMSKIIAGYEKAYEAFGIRKDGEIFPLRLEARNVPYKGKKVRTVEFRDITEQKRAEQELIKAKFQAEESEEKFRTLSENSPAIIYRLLLQPTLKFDYVSPVVTKITGFTPEDHYADPELGFKLVHPDDRILLENAKHFTMGEPIVLRWVRKDGKIIWTEQRNVLIFDKSGNPYAIEGIATDITAQKDAEGQLEFHANLLSQIGESVIATEINGAITYWNYSSEKLYGWTSSEVIGKNLQDILPTSVTSDDNLTIFDSLIKGLSWSGEYLVKSKDGRTFPIIVSDSPIFNSDDKLTGIIRVSSDISSRKQAEQELMIAKQQAEQSDQLKSAFLANMSHEIRTPMNGILGFADLLKEPNLTGEEQQKYISVIEKSGARMLNIINDIIDISKIEAGLMKAEIQESNINAQIEYIYTFFKPEVEAKGMKLLFRNTLPSKEAVIQTDREKLYSILTNLVKNAIKYTNEGFIEFGYSVETQNSESLQFYVKDTGIGIPKDRQEAIFERFVQADIEDKKARQGAGLGLAITKSYVEMLGGKIWVESQEGIGSTFYFTLPYNPKTAEKPEVKKVVSIQETGNVANTLHKRLKILIAEDDETSEKLISIIVNMFGKEIIKVHNGRDAIEACRDNPDIDLILMDIQMPVMGGYEATRQIRLLNKEVIIIAQTAYGLSGDREKAIEAGCNDYIAKPINSNALKGMVQKYFDKKEG